jgi:SM-20-related protein
VGLRVQSRQRTFVIEDGVGRVIAPGEVPTTPAALDTLRTAHHLPPGTPVASKTGRATEAPPTRRAARRRPRAEACAEARMLRSRSAGVARSHDASHERIASTLADRGFVVVPGFLAHESVTALRGEGARRRAAGEFRLASVGRAGSARRDVSIRGDSICWLGAGAASAPERALLAHLDALRIALNRALFLEIAELEAHYACYAPGARYARHLDRFRDDGARVISLVLYLNDDWRDADGGALRIYATRDAHEPVRELLPRGGTLVAMRSEAIAHEVLPALVERWSIAGWLRRRPR